MDKLTIHLQTKRRRKGQRISMVQHGAAALLLFIGGFSKLRAGEPEEFVIASLELLAGAAVLISMFFELRKSKKHEHSSIKWVDIFAAVMLVVEGISKLHAGPKHYPLAFTNFLAAIVIFLVGIFHLRITQSTRITLDAEGVKARTSPVRKLHLAWSEIQSITVDDAAIRFLTKNGERRVKLSNLTNGQDVQARFCDYLRSNDIEVNRLESGHSRQQDVASEYL
ncbi:MAG TPA: hypothetical protein VGN95_14800 [Pyrinomonadaceae bacterium]|nr:hypothetical protein [Pyrinomonadaceae bacterium]